LKGYAPEDLVIGNSVFSLGPSAAAAATASE
jgi:hypothetical protein